MLVLDHLLWSIGFCTSVYGAVYISAQTPEDTISLWIYIRSRILWNCNSFSAQTPEDTILFKQATIREVFFGVLTFSGAATNEQFTGDPPEETILFVANGDAHTTRARDKVGTGLASLSGIASCREIANYGYYGDDRDPGTSGLITISGSH